MDNVIHIGDVSLPPVPSDEIAGFAAGWQIPPADPEKSALLIRRLANQVQNMQYLIDQLRAAHDDMSAANVEKRDLLEELGQP